ncbi:hypothetical protein WN55_00557 [Dufourea novaeangliae]|uniref:Uncharacterized protein n=1 Tax=Dufourea novaeangliae TaxID=178035 RepID=A0A154PDK0_DUFNO|nr:hypothetical protein WN55_00557 [Dufourea novaeangliae]
MTSMGVKVGHCETWIVLCERGDSLRRNIGTVLEEFLDVVISNHEYRVHISSTSDFQRTLRTHSLNYWAYGL